MNSTTEQFIDLVKEELSNIKKFALPSEIANLERAHYVNPFSFSNCIYGIMTGNCDSSRGVELIMKCCTKRVINRLLDEIREGHESLEDGLPEGLFSDSARDTDGYFYSPLETLLWIGTNEEIQNIICFLRGCEELQPFTPEKWNYRDSSVIEEENVYISCSR